LKAYRKGIDMETHYEWYEFTMTGKVQAGSLDHARHSVYWAIRNSEADDLILIKEMEVTKEGKENG